MKPDALKPDSRLKRRTFLAAAACTPALALAALLARRQTVAETVLPELPDTAQPSSGYHETDHIRKYYRSADFF